MAAIFVILYGIVWCVCGWSGFHWRRHQYRRPIEHTQYILLLLSDPYNALANDNTMIDIIACKSGYTLIFLVNRARKMCETKIR